MLEDKTERLEAQGKKTILLDPGESRVEINERTDLEAMESIEAGTDSQLLLPMEDLETQ
jgi:hypothetical protein